MTIKKCSVCFIEKPINEFYVNKTYRTGYSYKCKECQKEYARIYRINNKDKRQVYNSSPLFKYRRKIYQHNYYLNITKPKRILESGVR